MPEASQEPKDLSKGERAQIIDYLTNLNSRIIALQIEQALLIRRTNEMAKEFSQLIQLLKST